MRILLATLIIAFSFNARAGLHLEPYLGYFTGGIDFGPVDYDLDGTNLGLRLGYSLPLGLAIGLEYMTSDLEDDDSPSDEYSHGSLGVFASYELPVMLRVYGTLFFNDKLEVDTAASAAEYEGTGLKLGVGLTMLPLVVINFEYYTATYDEFNSNSLTTDREIDLIGINVSLPLDL